jgi:hypothetical protein
VRDFPASSAEDTAGSDEGPRLAMNVAFAGHNRAADLGDPERIGAALRSAFQLLADAGLAYATLLTGLAEGADRIAARLWRELQLGPVHAVHPFLEGVDEGGLAHAATRLDGEALAAAGRNPHLAQTRWLIAAADLLVVVWTGGRGRGSGGTADAVRLALEHNVPVLWIKPGAAGHARLICPEHLDDDFGFLELVEQLKAGRAPLVRAATPESLRQVLQACTVDPRPDPPPPPQGFQAFLDRTLWRSYAVFVRALGGAAQKAERDPDAPADLLEQSGFQVLSELYREADAEAQRLASIHRSQQILVLIAAIGAAAIGSAPALWPEFKIWAVLCELALATVALAISAGAVRAERHERWSRLRRMAEQLRLERAAWVLGLSTQPHRLVGAGGSPVGARTARRQAALAEGAYDADRVRRWGDWAISELVAGQARYHRRQGALNHRIAHRIHLFETGSFAVFLAVLGGFAIAYLASHLVGFALPHWAAGAVVMTSVVVPALAAASIAVEATLAFGEQGRRNLETARRLEAIQASLTAEPDLSRLQHAARAAIRLEVTQEDRWTDESSRRRLVRAG